MAQRMNVIDLSLIPITGVPHKITVDGAYWILKVYNALATQFLDQTPLRNLGYQINAAPLFNVDFQTTPIFDANGKPVNWLQELSFRSTAAVITGTLTIVYWDPDKITDRDR